MKETMKKRKQPPSSSKTPLLVLAAGSLLLVLTAALIFTQNNPASRPTAAPTAASAASSDLPFPEVERVSLADARAALEDGSAVFVDVRSADVFAISHVPGAVNIPSTDILARLSELDPNRWIITYCT
jgi:3-mercaptopyruvate sulfurtransferase SseA